MIESEEQFNDSLRKVQGILAMPMPPFYIFCFGEVFSCPFYVNLARFGAYTLT